MNVDINVIEAKTVLIVQMTFAMNANAKSVRTMQYKSEREKQIWANLAKQYPYSYSLKDMAFSLFMGTMLGFIIGMMVGIGFCIR